MNLDNKNDDSFLRGHRFNLPLIYDDDFLIDIELIDEILKLLINENINRKSPRVSGIFYTSKEKNNYGN